MSNQIITAYLSDGRHVDVPISAAKDWSRETADLNTVLGLADWYTEQGDEHQHQIIGDAEDWPRCEHDHQLAALKVTNASQAEGYDSSRPHVAATVCVERACILDALAWVERSTGEPGVWIDADEKVRTFADLAGIS